MKKILLLLLSLSLYAQEEESEFIGEHYTAVYYDCEHLEDNSYVFESFIEAVWGSGAKFCKVCKHDFKPIGMTAVCLLYESHASIHTYPERGCVYVDLFTCGDRSYWILFEETLAEKLNAKRIESNVHNR